MCGVGREKESLLLVRLQVHLTKGRHEAQLVWTCDTLTWKEELVYPLPTHLSHSFWPLYSSPFAPVHLRMQICMSSPHSGAGRQRAVMLKVSLTAPLPSPEPAAVLGSVTKTMLCAPPATDVHVPHELGKALWWLAGYKMLTGLSPVLSRTLCQNIESRILQSNTKSVFTDLPPYHKHPLLELSHTTQHLKLYLF